MYLNKIVVLVLWGHGYGAGINDCICHAIKKFIRFPFHVLRKRGWDACMYVWYWMVFNEIFSFDGCVDGDALMHVYGNMVYPFDIYT